MKKIIALALSLMMLLGCVSALAENTVAIAGVFELKYGDLPEGYNVTVADDPVYDYTAIISKEDDSSIGYSLLINFNDQWSDLSTWADASANDIAAVQDDFYTVTELDDGDIIFSDYTTESGIPLLVALEKDGVFGALYTIYQSHEIEVDMWPADGHSLTVNDLDALIQFVETAQIVPAA